MGVAELPHPQPNIFLLYEPLPDNVQADVQSYGQNAYYDSTHDTGDRGEYSSCDCENHSPSSCFPHGATIRYEAPIFTISWRSQFWNPREQSWCSWRMWAHSSISVPARLSLP